MLFDEGKMMNFLGRDGWHNLVERAVGFVQRRYFFNSSTMRQPSVSVLGICPPKQGNGWHNLVARGS